MTQEALYGGATCPASDGAERQQTCNAQECPVDCVGEWSSWGSCSTTCGEGEVARSFAVSQPAAYGGEVCEVGAGDTDVKSCNTDVDCPVDCVGGWGSWSAECSLSCGGGNQVRTFSITVDAMFGGEPCPEANGAEDSSQSCNTQECPEDCEGSWGAWSECSETCGEMGEQVRSFTITSEAAYGGAVCGGSNSPLTNDSTETRDCSPTPIACPEDCEGSWDEWSTCTKTCGVGTTSRTFTVSDAAANGGASCDHQNGHVSEVSCSTEDCPVDCVGSWSAWSECDTTCGETGESHRTFVVTTLPTNGGQTCVERANAVETQECNTAVACPVDCVGGWSSWSVVCTQSCGGGVLTRTFTEASPAQSGGVDCPAEQSETATVPCQTQECPVDCEGSWDGWGSCSATCGGGMQSQTYRVSVAAEFGGQSCPRADGAVASQNCETQACPVDCVGEWNSWGSCSHSCGADGTRQRTFGVSQVAAHGGEQCAYTAGESDSESCNTNVDCPVDCIGAWSDWDFACSVSCGGGFDTRTFVVETEAAFGGVECANDDGETSTRDCSTQDCPVDCEGEWQPWGSCTTTCGSAGTRTREFAISVEAQHGGAACTYNDGADDVDECVDMDPCAIDCEGSWSEYGECDKTCGTGVKYKTFVVTTEADFGGSECVASAGDESAMSCNTQNCPRDCEGEWGEWQGCSLTCGGGEQFQYFQITTAAAHGGVPCDYAAGDANDGRSCNTDLCPIDCEGSWGEWSDQCSRSCNGGYHVRHYSVDTPSENGGTACPYDDMTCHFLPCNTQECPVDCEGAWDQEWSSCSESCGSGLQYKTYHVSQEALFGGAECPADDEETVQQQCNTHECPDPCEGSWSEWATCTTSCGAGTKTRSFELNVPEYSEFDLLSDDSYNAASWENGVLSCENVEFSGSDDTWTSDDDYALVVLKSGEPCAPRVGAAEATVTCTFTVDNAITGMWLNGEDVFDTIVNDACKADWQRPCEVTFEDTSFDGPQLFAFTGDERTFTGSAGQYCGRNGAGFAMVCVSSDPDSEWNNVQSDYTWQTYSSMTPLPASETGTEWYDTAFVGSSWNPPSTTNTGFSCPACTTVANGAGRSYDLVWASECSDYGYFRKVVAKSCSTTDTSATTIFEGVEAGEGLSTETGDDITHVIACVSTCDDVPEDETVSCSTDPVPCPIDCVGEWDSWGTCSHSCGADGTRQRTFGVSRAAAHGGEQCAYTAGESGSESCNTNVDCPVDCVGEWGSWSNACSVSCGGGFDTRTFAVQTEAAFGGVECANDDDETSTQVCSTQDCPVDCEGDWDEEWSECSLTCGSGLQFKTYHVTQEALYGGATCPASDGAERQQTCNAQECPVDCVGEWSSWGSCSTTCGEGEVARSFAVSQPAAYGGEVCEVGAGDTDVKSCNTDVDCPVDCVGGWGSWSAECSLSCGGGNQVRTFSITVDAMFGGEPCPEANGAEDSSQSCNTQECPEDCEGSWGEWSECSETCGEMGEQVRSFTITSEAAYGGAVCGGSNSPLTNDSTETRDCSPTPIACPEDCEGSWDEWSTCTKTCGVGTTSRTFTVSDAAANGGASCDHQNGHVSEVSCSTEDCPVDCVGSWSAWSECDTTCGETGESHRTFVVTTLPTNGGQTCVERANAVETQECNTAVACPVDCVGGWSSWSVVCTQSCGGGVLTRTFAEASPAQSGGVDCPAEQSETATVPCQTQECPVDCEGSWDGWGSCSATCGGGMQSQTYRVSVAAEFGGQSCPRADGAVASQNCETQACPVDCVGEWNSWGSCSHSCGADGTRQRTFGVSQVAAHGGEQCAYTAGESDSESCNTNVDCPVDCVGEWGSWSNACSVSCGGGFDTRTFAVQTEAAFGGVECANDDDETSTQDCSTQECPVDCEGAWDQEWSSCSESCGSGLQYKTYHVSQEALFGGAECPADDEETVQQQCNTHECPDPCEGSWSEWATCTTSCGAGTKTRSFELNVPEYSEFDLLSDDSYNAASWENGVLSCENVEFSGSDDTWTSDDDYALVVLKSGEPCAPRVGAAEATVTCTFTVDNAITGMWLNGEDVFDTIVNDACKADWRRPCEVTFEDTSFDGPQLFAFTGDERTFTGSAGQYCGRSGAGFAMVCVSSDPDSEWNNVQSDYTWQTYSSMTPLPASETGTEWYDTAFVGSSWNPPSTTNTGFSCPACTTVANGAGRSYDLVWASECSDYGYFRKVVAKSCSTADTSATTIFEGVEAGEPLSTETGDDITHVIACVSTCDDVPEDETVSCSTDPVPCPIDCVGEWDSWGTCSHSCGADGTRQRTFGVSRAAAHGGEQCAYTAGESDSESCNTNVDCPVDCVGEWGAWSESCSFSCAGGLRERTFEVDVEASFGGVSCSYTQGQVDNGQTCNTQECPVDCEGDWDEEWSECSLTCGSGLQFKTYHVTQEALYGGATCPASDGAERQQTCNAQECPVDCVGEWSSWGSCSTTCGEGEVARSFAVSQPAAYGGEVCEVGAGDTDVKSCNTDVDCPVDCVGGWGSWSAECSLSCGGGNQVRTFSITVDAMFGGEPCPEANGAEDSSQSCNTQECPEDCEGSWGEWSECSETCGEMGEQVRSFTITSEAAYGGAVCGGSNSPLTNDSTETRDCSPTPIACPEDCEGSWDEWSTCTKTCGVGTTSRTFTVSDAAANGGASCDHQNGHVSEVSCSTEDCPVDCVGSWSAWSECDTTCGETGESHRTFVVTTLPTNGGQTCVERANAVETQECNTAVACPVDCVGGWSSWSVVCTQSCGGGVLTRTFTEASPAQSGGVDCPAEQSETATVPCQTQECPVDCEGSWDGWGSCSATCGGGMQSQTYRVSVAAEFGGQSCPRADGAVASQNCETQACPVDCVGEWNSWGSCSHSCGADGTRQRTFGVSQVAAHGGEQCAYTAGESDSESCNTNVDCPVDCVGEWGSWSNACSVSCGGGFDTRTFAVQTEAAFGGVECANDDDETSTQDLQHAGLPCGLRG